MSSPPRTATARCRSSPSMARPAVRRNLLITADRLGSRGSLCSAIAMRRARAHARGAEVPARRGGPDEANPVKQRGKNLLAATALLVSPALLAPVAVTPAAPAAAAPRPVKEPSRTKGSDVVQRTGPGVFSPATGVWRLHDLPDARWGRRGDVPVAGDYDGDGRTDVAVWRPSTGMWFVRGLPDARWGRRGDVPVAGDYDGDGRTDVAVWRPSTGVWLVRGLPDARWGRRGDVPVAGDYDGDGRTDVAVWRP